MVPFLKDKAKFRTKFAVHACEWNPRMDVVALASRKGELVVKRYGLKTAWKRDFHRETHLKHFTDTFLRAPVDLPGNDAQNGLSTPKPDSLSTIRWSPDGEVLLVAFDSGLAYYLNAQSGRPVYAKSLLTDNSPGPEHTGIVGMRWFSLLRKQPWRWEEDDEEGEVSEGNAYGDAAALKAQNSVSKRPSAQDFSALETKPSEAKPGREAKASGKGVVAGGGGGSSGITLVNDVESFCYQLLPQSLANTLLAVIVSGESEASHQDGPSLTVDLYVDGVMHLARLDILQAIEEAFTNAEELPASPRLHIDRASVRLLDLDLLSLPSKVATRQSAETAAPAPNISNPAGPILAAVVKYCAHAEEEEEATSAAHGQSPGGQWCLSTVEWNLGSLLGGGWWEENREEASAVGERLSPVGSTSSQRRERIAASTINEMSFAFLYLREVFAAIGEDWARQSEAFHRRVLSGLVEDNTSPFQVCQEFLLLLTTGQVGQSMTDYLQSDATPRELKLAKVFVEENFGALLRGIASCLRPALKYLSHELVPRLRSASLLSGPKTKPNEEAGTVRLGVIDSLARALSAVEGVLDEMESIAKKNRDELMDLLAWLNQQCTLFVKEMDMGEEEAEEVEVEDVPEHRDGKDGQRDRQRRLVDFFMKASSGLYSFGSPASSSPNNGITPSMLEYLDAWRNHAFPQEQGDGEDVKMECTPSTPAHAIELDRVFPYVQSSFPQELQKCLAPLLWLLHHGVQHSDAELVASVHVEHVELLQGLPSCEAVILPSSPPVEPSRTLDSEPLMLLVVLRQGRDSLLLYRLDTSGGGKRLLPSPAATTVFNNGLSSIRSLQKCGATLVYGLVEIRRAKATREALCGDGEKLDEGTFIFRIVSSVGSAMSSNASYDVELDLISNFFDSPAIMKVSPSGHLTLVLGEGHDRLAWLTNDGSTLAAISQ